MIEVGVERMIMWDTKNILLKTFKMPPAVASNLKYILKVFGKMFFGKNGSDE